jgi:hypothetical protein
MDISAILVNHNGRAHIGPCLKALASELPSGGEIIVVDNASTDGSPEYIAAEFPAVKLIAGGSNPGFGAANNRGAAAAAGRGFLFLNTDTVVGPGSIGRLRAALDGSPGTGAVGPALVHPDGSYQVSFGRWVGFLGQLVQKTVLNPYWKRALGRRVRPLRPGWLSAACCLVRREAFEAAGGFDETFFLYFEDIDLCRRIRREGWRLLFEPRARVVHIGGGSTAARPAEARFEYRRGQLRYYTKHAPALSRFFLRLYLRAAVAAAGLRGGFRGPQGRALRERYRTLLAERSRRP